MKTADGRYVIRETARDIVPRHIRALTSHYPRIAVPTLIIWGRHDKVVPLHNGSDCIARFGNRRW